MAKKDTVVKQDQPKRVVEESLLIKIPRLCILPDTGVNEIVLAGNIATANMLISNFLDKDSLISLRMSLTTFKEIDSARLYALQKRYGKKRKNDDDYLTFSHLESKIKILSDVIALIDKRLYVLGYRPKATEKAIKRRRGIF